MRKIPDTSDRLWFLLLQRDTADRAGYRAEVTGYATLFAVRIAGQNDTTTITGRQIDRLFRVHSRFAFGERVQADHPDTTNLGTETY